MSEEKIKIIPQKYNDTKNLIETDDNIEIESMTIQSVGVMQPLIENSYVEIPNDPNKLTFDTEDIKADNKLRSPSNDETNAVTKISIRKPKKDGTPRRMTGGEDTENNSSLLIFYFLYTLTEFCGIILLVLLSSWIAIYMGGFGGLFNPTIAFHWHPFFLTFGLVFLYGNSILIFRYLRMLQKNVLKILHISLHGIAFICTVIGLEAIFASRHLKDPAKPHMFSMHSWIGISAVIIFCLQYVCGFVAYMLPYLDLKYKIAYMPFHIFFGLFGFVLTIATSLMGLSTYVSMKVEDYQSLNLSGILPNLCGIVLVIYGTLVIYLATNPSYRRINA